MTAKLGNLWEVKEKQEMDFIRDVRQDCISGDCGRESKKKGWDNANKCELGIRSEKYTQQVNSMTNNK